MKNEYVNYFKKCKRALITLRHQMIFVKPDERKLVRFHFQHAYKILSITSSLRHQIIHLTF